MIKYIKKKYRKYLGIELEFRRAWHTKIWLPQLPAGSISLTYDFRMIDDIPTYEIDMSMSQWNPLREQISIIINGIEGRDLSIVIDGLDTSKPNDKIVFRGTFVNVGYDYNLGNLILNTNLGLVVSGQTESTHKMKISDLETGGNYSFSIMLILREVNFWAYLATF